MLEKVLKQGEKIPVFRVPVSDFAQIESAARRSEVTVSTLCHAAWAVVLAHYSGENRVVIGSTESGRTVVPTALSRVRGLSINTFPMVIDFDWEQNATDWLQAVQANYSADVEHAAFPLAQQM